ncbi:MAG: N-acetylneuraminate synthase [Bacteroidales bacterium]|nr:N-acetylneuraminate synthase [Bacteroidales bacterium]
MNKVIIIAEAGVNHNGSLEMAKQLVDAAKEAGADYVKFQTGIPRLLTSKFAVMADYQKKNIGSEQSQLEMIEKISLTFDDFSLLKRYCDETGVKFLSTPFDLPSVDFLSEFEMDYFKIPSGEITNLPYLRKIAKLGTPVIMSTGMCELKEIEEALRVLTDNGLPLDSISLLHCNTEYPTPMHDVNLRAMETLKERFCVKTGYSDHTEGIEVPIAAVAMGADIIEKHFTLDKTLPGPDHIASLEPHELNAMVKAIRNIEMALGSDKKSVTASERKNILIARKSIIAAKDIKAGELFTEENLTVKRPGNGISPMKWDEVIGQRAKKDFLEDQLIEI